MMQPHCVGVRSPVKLTIEAALWHQAGEVIAQSERIDQQPFEAAVATGNHVAPAEPNLSVTYSRVGL